MLFLLFVFYKNFGFIFFDNKVLFVQSKLWFFLKKNNFRFFRFYTKILINSLSVRLKVVREFLGSLNIALYKDDRILLDSYNNLYYVFNLRRSFLPKFRKIFFVRKINGSFSSFFLDESYDRLNILLWNNFMEPFSQFYLDRSSFSSSFRRSNVDNFLILRNTFLKRQHIFWLLRLKFLNFFSSINCDWVLKNCPINKLILKSWFKYFKFSSENHFYLCWNDNIIISGLVNFMLVGLLRINGLLN